MTRLPAKDLLCSSLSLSECSKEIRSILNTLVLRGILAFSLTTVVSLVAILRDNDVTRAALSSRSRRRSLAAVISVVVRLIRFHVYFVCWLLLFTLDGLIARYYVLAGLFWRNWLGHQVLSCHDAAIRYFDAVFKRSLAHHVQRFGGDSAHGHCIV